MTANNEKDRYGDKLRDLERAREDKYFSDRDKELIEKAKRQKAGTPAGAPSKDAPPGRKPDKPDQP